MDASTLIAALDFSHARLLGILDTIEKSGEDTQKVLAWRPAPGRAHIGWQAMHCAATHDRYLNARLKGGTESDPELVKNFGGGSTPSDDNVPTLADIRASLEKHLASLRAFVAPLKPEDFSRVHDMPNNAKRTVGESIHVLIWHEAHHQGQIHLTWNLYKAAHGVK